MSFLSFFKRKKKNKAPDVHECTLAEDVLQTNLAKPANEPMECAALDPLSFRSKQPTNITLVRGASDSKSAGQSSSKSRRHVENSSIKKNSHANITQPKITNVQYVHKAPLPSETLSVAMTSRLYPDLDIINNEKHSLSAEPKLTAVEEPKSIHDMFVESARLCLFIQEKVRYAMTVKKKLHNLKINTEKEVLEVFNVIKNSSEFQYDFEKELDVRRNYSYVQDYEKLNTFNDVKKYQKRANQRVKRKLSNTTEAVPIFQSYQDKLMCYKGQKRDIIDCD